MTELQESLKKCPVNGNAVSLPTERLANYADVRKALLNAGAKYKSNTFVFPNDAQPYIDRLMGGEKVNIKKEFQFFGTPSELADKLVEMADLKAAHVILEPSAGQGAIIKAIWREIPDKTIFCCELMDINRSVLQKMGANVNCVGVDFLTTTLPFKFDRIIANPPFNKNQDIDHIRKMYDCLKPGGRLVSIASMSWYIGSQKKQVEFKNWLDQVGATTEEIEKGAFKESGTEVGGFIITIDK